MKSFHKHTAAILSALLITSAMPFAASAAQTESSAGASGIIRGDVVLDGVVKISDATSIQRYLAKYESLSADQLKAADVNGERSCKHFGLNRNTKVHRKIRQSLQHRRSDRSG